MLSPARKLRYLAGALLGTCGLFLAAQTPAPAQVPANIPQLPPRHSTARPAKPRPPKAPLVDINHASRAALMALPGIDGPAADKIIAGRPYLTKSHLVTQNVLSMGAFQGIRTRIVAGGAVQALKKTQGK